MTLEEIKQSIKAGMRVFWKDSGYEVICDNLGHYLIVCACNQSATGLTWLDGTTLNGEEKDFYIMPAGYN